MVLWKYLCRYRRRPLGGGGEKSTGDERPCFFLETLLSGLQRSAEVLCIFLCSNSNCAILVVFFLLNCATCFYPASVFELGMCLGY
jgi:hypothetical protein